MRRTPGRSGRAPRGVRQAYPVVRCMSLESLEKRARPWRREVRARAGACRGTLWDSEGAMHRTRAAALAACAGVCLAAGAAGCDAGFVNDGRPDSGDTVDSDTDSDTDTDRCPG